MNKWMKYIIVCLLFVGLSMPMADVSMAKEKDAFLENYDKDLKKVPFPIKYQFMKDTKRNWKNTTYSERLAFVRAWEKGYSARQRAESLEERAKKREDVRKEREKQRLDRIEKRREQVRERERQREKRKKEKEEREFKRKIEEQKRKLQKLKQEQERRKRKLRINK